MLTYQKLKKNTVRFLAATSLTAAEFENLLPAFTAAYEKKYPRHQTLAGKPRQRGRGGGAKGLLEQDENRLLFILVYQQTNPLQQRQGLQFGMSQAQANYLIHHLLPVLQQALNDLGHKPERAGDKAAAHRLITEGAPDLVIDGTERRRQRPKNDETQKEHYSGKQKAHTDKNLLLVNEQTTQVVYLSPTVPGKKHYKKMADEAQISYPANARLGQDTGFQGYKPAGALTTQPKKSRAGKSCG
jgi:hypothetical protein